MRTTLVLLSALGVLTLVTCGSEGEGHEKRMWDPMMGKRIWDPMQVCISNPLETNNFFQYLYIYIYFFFKIPNFETIEHIPGIILANNLKDQVSEVRSQRSYCLSEFLLAKLQIFCF